MEMERNEEFYELSNIIDNCDSSYCDYVAEILTEEGYRKEKYVRKETAERLLGELMAKIEFGDADKLVKVFAIFKKYGVKVDE